MAKKSSRGKKGNRNKLYSFEDHPEHKALLSEWRDKWIANAMSTKPMDDGDRNAMRIAIRGLYAAAGLEPPPDRRIVFAPSPAVVRFAGGFAAWIWHARKAVSSATRAATDAADAAAATDAATYAAADAAADAAAATRAATAEATDAATDDATAAATRDATYNVTRAATAAATRDATDAATRDAIRAATRDATYDATRAATDAATYNVTRAAIASATDAATDAATDDATRAATYAAIDAATRAATDDATRDATYAATYNVTRAAIASATIAATDAATRAATNDATSDATDAATRAATSDATRAATSDATYADFSRWYVLRGDMIRCASFFGNPSTLLRCATTAYNMWHGGNQWSGWTAYISFFRHVAKLEIDYSKWQHYESAVEHGGPLVMHKEFCIVSDRPRVLLVDDQNRPHCDDGPFCRWADGFALYAIHGVRVPAWIVERPQDISLATINAETNAEIRRIMIERYGAARYLKEMGAKVIDTDHGIGVTGSAPRALLQDVNGDRWLVGTDGSTKRVYHMPVPTTVNTCREAHNAICGFDETLILNEG